MALAIDSSSPTTIYAGSEVGGLFRSTDGGASWAAANNGIPGTSVTWALVINPLTPNVLYAGESNGKGVFKSNDSGATWARASTGIPSLSVSALAINPSTPSILYAGTDGGVFKSTDSGGTWAASSAGLPAGAVQPIVINQSLPSTLYAGTLRGGVFRSTDSGGTWSPVNTGFPWDPPVMPGVQALALDPAGTTLYAGLWYGSVWQMSTPLPVTLTRFAVE
jgi:photosystem II stability/assembly factor-like uncharacterized protein